MHGANSARMMCYGALTGFYTHNDIIYNRSWDIKAVYQQFIFKSKSLLEAVFRGNESIEIATLKKEVEERNKQLQQLVAGLAIDNYN